MQKTTTTLPALLATLALALPAQAAEEAGLKETLDGIWGRATLYSDKENEYVQKVAFTGRLQYDYAYVDGDELGDWDDWTWRRARAGFKATVLKDFTVHVEADLDLEETSPVYTKLTDAYVGWQPRKDLAIKLGKQSTGFTLDGATSSKSLITAERSKLSDNIWFTTEYFTGVSASGDKDNWSYFAGVFSNDNGDEFEEVGEEEYFVLLSAGYDFGERLSVDHAIVRLDYVHNEESLRLGTKRLANIVSLSGQYDNGPWHLWADLAYAEAFNGNDIWGFEVMPFYDINKTFQVAAQYSYVSSADPRGVSIGRYERALVGGRGDELQTFYVGLNTYIYGHKLKWQNGLQYTDMEDEAGNGGDFNGIGFTSAVRITW